MKRAFVSLLSLFVWLSICLHAYGTQSCEEKLQEIRLDLTDAGQTISLLRADVANQRTALGIAVAAKAELVLADGRKTAAYTKLSTAYTHVVEQYAAEVKSKEHWMFLALGLAALIAIYVGLKLYPATRMFIP